MRVSQNCRGTFKGVLGDSLRGSGRRITAKRTRYMTRGLCAAKSRLGNRSGLGRLFVYYIKGVFVPQKGVTLHATDDVNHESLLFLQKGITDLGNPTFC